MSWRWSDVARSMVVLLAIIAAVALYQSLWSDKPSSPQPTVDYAPAVSAARDDARYPVLAPADLPDGWRATSVRYDPGPSGSWHLGVHTSDEEYVGLEQASVSPAALVERTAAATDDAGSIRIDGDVWQLRRDDERGETTLVRRGDGVTTLVTGTVGQETLEEYVRSLRSG